MTDKLTSTDAMIDGSATDLPHAILSFKIMQLMSWKVYATETGLDDISASYWAGCIQETIQWCRERDTGEFSNVLDGLQNGRCFLPPCRVFL